MFCHVSCHTAVCTKHAIDLQWPEVKRSAYIVDVSLICYQKVSFESFSDIQ